MKEMDIQSLLKKAEELKALFVLGQRVIPFLEEIFKFFNEIKPLLDDINKSIVDNLQKMPKASKQLSKVTEATELATTEIMDIVDGIVYKTQVIHQNNHRISDYFNNLKNINIDEELKAEINKLFTNNDSLLDSIQNDSNDIMTSLQIQDITSQQLAAVNHLLQTVQVKLTNLMTKFNADPLEDLTKTKEEYHERTNITQMHRQIAFDPDAVDAMSLSGSRQAEVDDLFNSISVQQNIEVTAQSEQNSIGSLVHEEESVIPEQEEEVVDDSDEFSQGDIDALFNGKK
jgi:chemotaxis regulatin CheY-phosphate phosphatase CheZ